MSDKSAIEWTDATWNPTTGCTKVSPGCAHCYIDRTPPFRIEGRTFDEHGSTGVRLHPDRLDQPLRWRRPRRIFVNSLSDLFHEEIPDQFIVDVFQTMAMAKASQHTFQVLTKRPERALELLGGASYCEHGWLTHNGDNPTAYGGTGLVLPEPWPTPNVWLGVSIENARHTWRADVLREIPAAVRFISAEPLLGSLLPERCGAGCFPDVGGSYVCGRVKGHGGLHASRYLQGATWEDKDPGKCWLNVEDTRWARPLNLEGIDWVIVGGESGPDARAMHPDWAREIRDACVRQACCGQWRAECCGSYLPTGECCSEPVQACCYEPDREGPAFFFKQWGEWAPGMLWTGFGEKGEEMLFSDGTYMRRVGKRRAGRELDGRTWDEMPDDRQAAAA